MKLYKKTGMYVGAALSTFVAIAVTATPAQAQATRTWVSGVGDDVNPCSRTAPCKTFAGAISKTAAGGEINCLDPGGYGAVTITKSMTIDCHYTEGGALAGGNGIVVNDSLTATPNTAVVYLRGLDIFGVNPPTNGIRFVAGAGLILEDVTIRRFNAVNSWGISFAPSGNSFLVVRNSIISNNGNGATGGGITLAPTGAGSASAFITDSSISQNGGVGLNAVGAVFARVGNTSIFGNTTGLAASGGAINASYQDNRVDGNGVDGTFGQNIPKK